MHYTLYTVYVFMLSQCEYNRSMALMLNVLPGSRALFFGTEWQSLDMSEISCYGEVRS